jgi:hypothetical protein
VVYETTHVRTKVVGYDSMKYCDANDKLFSDCDVLGERNSKEYAMRGMAAREIKGMSSVSGKPS